MKNRIVIPAQAGIEPSETGFRARSGMTAVFSSDLTLQRNRGVLL